MHTPFVISGKNMRSGKQIETSMVQYNVVATIAYFFDLKTLIVWTGKPIKKVFK